jgi:hypothetical protein
LPGFAEACIPLNLTKYLTRVKFGSNANV